MIIFHFENRSSMRLLKLMEYASHITWSWSTAWLYWQRRWQSLHRFPCPGWLGTVEAASPLQSNHPQQPDEEECCRQAVRKILVTSLLMHPSMPYPTYPRSGQILILINLHEKSLLGLTWDRCTSCSILVTDMKHHGAKPSAQLPDLG